MGGPRALGAAGPAPAHAAPGGVGWATGDGMPLATSGQWVGQTNIEFGFESRRHGHRTGATAGLHSRGVCRCTCAVRPRVALVGYGAWRAGRPASGRLRLSGGAPCHVSAAGSVWRSVLQTARMCMRRCFFAHRGRAGALGRQVPCWATVSGRTSCWCCPSWQFSEALLSLISSSRRGTGGLSDAQAQSKALSAQRSAPFSFLKMVVLPSLPLAPVKAYEIDPEGGGWNDARTR